MAAHLRRGLPLTLSAVNRRKRTALDHPVQRLPLLIVEQRRVARCLAIHQARWPLGVES